MKEFLYKLLLLQRINNKQEKTFYFTYRVETGTKSQIS